MRIVSFLLIVIFLSGCSANYYLKRSQKLERRAIEMGAKVTVDTVYVDRQVIVPESHTDTLVSWLENTDTIYITKDRIVTKVKINPIEKTVYVDAKCLPDTVLLRVPVEVIKKIETSAGIGKYAIYGFILLFVIGLIVGASMFKK